MHKTSKDIINGDPRRNRMEFEGEEGVQTYLMMKDGRFEAMQPKRNDLMSVILSSENLNKAYKQVVSNQGAGGIDKMDCKAHPFDIYDTFIYFLMPW